MHGDVTFYIQYDKRRGGMLACEEVKVRNTGDGLFSFVFQPICSICLIS